MRVIFSIIMKSERLPNMDLFKIICIINVIILHVSAYNAFDAEYSYIFNQNFIVLNFYNMITRFCVPGFIMISGMFLLDRDISIKTIFKKYIFRIALIYLIFSLIYSFVLYSQTKQTIIPNLIKGYYHLWYLYVIIGLYLVTPFLRKIVKDRKITEYFIILNFVFASIIPSIINYFNLYDLKIAVNNFNVFMPMGYVGYYIMGYYLSKHEINNKIFYFLGVLGFVFNYVLFYKIKYSHTLYDSIFLMPGTYLQSIAIFLFFKNLKIKNNNIISYISGLTFSIYLVHMLIMNLTFYCFPYFIYQNSIISVLIISVIVFVASLLVSIYIKKIPILKKFI